MQLVPRQQHAPNGDVIVPMWGGLTRLGVAGEQQLQRARQRNDDTRMA